MTAAPKRAVAPKAKRPRFNFVRNIWAEMKKVVWPTREQTTYLTIVVIAITVAVGAILGVVDWGFTHLVSDVIIGGS